MIQRLRDALLVMIVAAVSVGAGLTSPLPLAAKTQVTIGGTGSALGCMKKIAEAFEQGHPGVSA